MHTCVVSGLAVRRDDNDLRYSLVVAGLRPDEEGDASLVLFSASAFDTGSFAHETLARRDSSRMDGHFHGAVGLATEEVEGLREFFERKEVMGDQRCEINAVWLLRTRYTLRRLRLRAFSDSLTSCRLSSFRCSTRSDLSSGRAPRCTWKSSRSDTSWPS